VCCCVVVLVLSVSLISIVCLACLFDVWFVCTRIVVACRCLEVNYMFCDIV